MGYISHQAIVVTSWSLEKVTEAHAKAKEIFPKVSELVHGECNGYVSFFVPPDGSKEGWEESDTGDTRRTSFLRWLDKQRYSDHSTSIAWVEVRFGDDNGITEICRHSDQDTDV